MTNQNAALLRRFALSRSAMAALAIIVPEQQVIAQATPEAGKSEQADQDQIGDIIVTAQKRAQNVQRTPAAVTAVSGTELATRGITDLRAVQSVVPGARFQPEGNSTQVFLRGVGASLDFVYVEPAVAFNVNGVFLPREATSAPLYDVERVEVLPGPQGTLYGRGALGGAINVGFKRPTFDWETSGLVEGGNYNFGHATLVQNIPLGNDLAIRGAVDLVTRSGFNESGADSQKDIAGRLSLLYKPSDALSIYLWGYGYSKNGKAPNLVNKGTDPDSFAYDENAFVRKRPWDDLRPGTLAATAPFGQPRAESVNYTNYVAGGEINIGLGDNVTLTYIPSYVYLKSSYFYWLGAIPAFNSPNYRTTSHELRLAGNSGKLDWLVGAYGYRSKSHQSIIVLPGIFNVMLSAVDAHRLEGLAGFGQLTFHVSDQLRLTAGGRYSVDDRRMRGQSLIDGSPYRFRNNFHNLDYKIGLEYDLSPQAMAYATYQTGYQPGTFNEANPTGTYDNEIKKQTLNAVTAGFKSRFADSRLQINSEAFCYIYHDLFIQAFNASRAFNPVFNAKKVEIYGNQLDVTFKPSRDNQIMISASYVHARNKDFTVPLNLPVSEATAGQSFDGFSLAYAPDWTFVGAAYQDVHLPSGYFRARADIRYETHYYADFAHDAGTRQSRNAKINASLTYYADNDKWNLGLWGRNLTNKAVVGATATGGIPGPGTAYLEAPRTFGARLGFNF